MTGAVLVLGLRTRSLEERNRGLVKRFTEPHPGMLVPAFTARSLRGDSIVIGAGTDDRLQVLFFITSTCDYCTRSLPALSSLDSAFRADSGAKASVYLVGVDSAGKVRRFADSASVTVTVLNVPNQRMALLYRVRAVPQLIVLDSAGRAVFTRSGALLTTAARDSVLEAVRQRALLRRAARDSIIGTF